MSNPPVHVLRHSMIKVCIWQNHTPNDPSKEELKAIREGIAEAETGRVRSIEEFDRDYRARNGFASGEQS